jgi:hypothetical protein
MRKLLLASAISLFYYSYLQGDDSAKLANNIVVFQQGFVIESLSGYGFSSSATFPIYNLGSGNPAMISNFSRPSLGVSYQYNTQLDSFSLGEATFQRANNLIPQSAGFVYPIQNLGLGAGFSQKYSSELGSEFRVVDPQDPSGTGEYITAISKKTIFSFSTLASYQFINLLSKADLLSVGVQVNINLLRVRQSISDLTDKLNDEAVNWKFGLGYTYRNKSIEKFQFGIAYESKINFSDYYQSNRELITPPTSPEFVPIPAILTYPARLKLGFMLEPISTFDIYNDFTYNFWEDMMPYYKNRMDMSGGIVVRASSEISISMGYYLFESYLADEFLSDLNGDAVFISGGLILKYGQLDLHFVLADSHLFSGERSKQTIGKMGFAFNF